MPPIQFTAKLADRRVLNDKFLHLIFELVNPSRVAIQAGQYVSIKVAEDGTRRSYSICNNPDGEHQFEVMLDITPMGVGVQYLYALKPGSEISCLGPIGAFTINEEQVGSAPLIFVATGSGLAPIRSMVLDQLLEKKRQTPMMLYWGLRHETSMCWVDEFADLATRYHNFTFHPVLSQATPAWPLCRGRVTDCLLVHDLLAGAHYFVCGGKNMIVDVTATLIQRGVPEANIHHEKFF